MAMAPHVSDSHKLAETYLQTSRTFQYISASLAFLLWGGWAYFINSGTTSTSGIVPAITQGSYSFIITLLMTHFITFQYNRIPAGVWRTFLPPVITISLTGTLLVFIHKLVGTPEILFTVTPALSIALLFSFYTVYKLHSSSPHERSHNADNP